MTPTKMKTLLIISHWIPMYLSYKVEHINNAHLLQEYVLVCGFEFLCDREILHFSIYPNFTSLYRDKHLCPDCQCDNACYRRGDCCPDLILSEKHWDCVPTTLFAPNSKIDLYQMMTTTCPNNVNDLLRNACERNYTVTERISVPPVTSQNRSITFKNKFCAMCNGVEDFQMWSLDIKCDLAVDFNYLSSNEEIVKSAEEGNCSIAHDPGIIPVHKCKTNELCSESYSNDVRYDAMAWACSFFKQEYRIFSNIFCFICSQQSKSWKSEKAISNCNSTDSWRPYDPGLENACLSYNSTVSTFPFKNIFCYMCNRDWIDKSGRYLDSSVTILEKVYSKTINSSFNYIVDLHSLKITSRQFENMNHNYKINSVNKCTREAKYFDEYFVNRRLHVNMSNLILKYYSATGYRGGSSCGNYNLSITPADVDHTYPCSCDKFCVTTYENCCVDMALLNPTTCLSSTYLTNDPLQQQSDLQYFVYDGCRMWQHKGSADMCKQKEYSNALFCIIPIYVANSEKTYRNFYCEACGLSLKTNRSAMNHVLNTTFEPFDINITCDNYIDFTHYLYIEDVIKVAKEQKCHITLILEYRITLTCAPSNKYNIMPKQCNVTGQWENFDPDIQWACESLKDTFTWRFDTKNSTNLFCDICNPSPTNGSVISRCNVTGQWTNYNSEVEKACELFPVVQYLFPYKNAFCKLCNIDNVEERNEYIQRTHDPEVRMVWQEDTDTKEIISQNNQPIFRKVFPLSSYIEPDITAPPLITTCYYSKVDTIQNTCRSISCYPGKRLINNTCLPFLPVVSNMTYTMSFGLEGSTDGLISTVSLLSEIEMKIKQNIYMALNPNKINFQYFLLVSDLSCLSKDDLRNSSQSVRIDVTTTFYVNGYIDRYESENKLLAIIESGSKIETNLDSENHTFVIHTNDDSYFAMTDIADYRRKCHIMRQINHTFTPFKHYQRQSHVSKLLTCRQVLLNKNEFVSVEFKQLKVLQTGVSYKSNEYEISSEGTARVCLEDYLLGESYRQPDILARSLGIVTQICVILSLVFLLLTFITYALFPELRSLPGKNNMCLVFSLFCTQAFLYFGLRQTYERIFCNVIGIFLHYFWLSTFGCINICCFHMYRTLAGSLTDQLDTPSNNKLLLKYICYSFGLPFLIILINITATIGMTYGQSIGYEGHMCFLTNIISAAITFIAPLACMCLSTIGLICSTLYKIYQTPIPKTNMESRNEVILYGKLFILTVIAWTLIIVDSFLPLSPFSFIVTILNGFQGAFIFLSYICKTNVLRLYKNLVRKEDISVITSDSGLKAESSSGNQQSTENET